MGEVEDSVSGTKITVGFISSLEVILAFSVRDLIPAIDSNINIFCTPSLLFFCLPVQYFSMFDYSVLISI